MIMCSFDTRKQQLPVHNEITCKNQTFRVREIKHLNGANMLPECIKSQPLYHAGCKDKITSIYGMTKIYYIPAFSG